LATSNSLASTDEGKFPKSSSVRARAILAAKGGKRVIAESLTDAQGMWLLTGAGAIAFIAFGVNQVMGILVKRKQLTAPIITQQQINPQPLIVAMEKEFVSRHEYDASHVDLKREVVEVRKYAHDEVHAVDDELESMKQAGEERDRLLHKLDERTQTQTRLIGGLDIKLDRVVDRLADKIELLLRNDRKERT
jgi:sulfur carrier protein ThiS